MNTAQKAKKGPGDPGHPYPIANFTGDVFHKAVAATASFLGLRATRCAVCEAKVPPHSVEAEQSVLGGLLLDNTAWDRLGDVMMDEDFYHAGHRMIFQHIGQLIERNKPADALTVAEVLNRSGLLDDVGGPAYIGSLALNTPSAANIRCHAAIVSECAIMRRLAAVGAEITHSAFNPKGKDAAALIKAVGEKIFRLAEAAQNPKQGFARIDPFITEAVEQIDMLFSRKNKSDVTGLETGFVDLDRMTTGLQPGELTVIAARPSMGKTALAMNMVEHVAVNLKKSVAVFSMGMPGSLLAMRMIGSLGRIGQHQLRTGTFKEEDWPRLVDAVGKLNDAQIYIDDTASPNAFEVSMRARRLHHDISGLDLVVVDYLQPMLSITPDREENKATAIAGILRSLKALAMELKVPVVVLSQLNQSDDLRQDKRPTMSDLHESGVTEQDADLILFIYRDEVYFSGKHAAQGKTEVLIRKQRNGPIGTVNLVFLGQHAGFENQTEEEA